jgi:hypothetical protein
MQFQTRFIKNINKELTCPGATLQAPDASNSIINSGPCPLVTVHGVSSSPCRKRHLRAKCENYCQCHTGAKQRQSTGAHNKREPRPSRGGGASPIQCMCFTRARFERRSGCVRRWVRESFDVTCGQVEVCGGWRAGDGCLMKRTGTIKTLLVKASFAATYSRSGWPPNAAACPIVY